jgi:hypothetical protein
MALELEVGTIVFFSLRETLGLGWFLVRAVASVFSAYFS